MLRETLRTSSRWSRRSALGGVGAAAVTLGLGLSRRVDRVAAQESTPAAMAGHPLVGTWIVDRNPADPSEMPTTNVFTAGRRADRPVRGRGRGVGGHGPATRRTSP